MPYPLRAPREARDAVKDNLNPDDDALSAEDARQGRIILRTRASRLIFIAGLVAVVAAAIGVALSA